MVEKFSTFFQGEEIAENFTFVIPPKENENSGHVEVITFSPPNNDRPDMIDSPSQTQPHDPDS